MFNSRGEEKNKGWHWHFQCGIMGMIMRKIVVRTWEKDLSVWVYYKQAEKSTRTYWPLKFFGWNKLKHWWENSHGRYCGSKKNGSWRFTLFDFEMIIRGFYSQELEMVSNVGHPKDSDDPHRSSQDKAWLSLAEHSACNLIAQIRSDSSKSLVDCSWYVQQSLRQIDNCGPWQSKDLSSLLRCQVYSIKHPMKCSGCLHSLAISFSVWIPHV